MDIFPVVTLFLGYGASYLTELFRDRRTARREREARAASQQERDFERHVTFQAKTLLEMQEAALDCVQIGTQFLIQWNSHSSKRNDWRGARPRDDLFNRFLLARARSGMIAARVNDPIVRKRIDEIHTHADKLLGAQEGEEASKELAFMFAHSEKLNERIGEVLRQLNTCDNKSGNYLPATKTAAVKLPPPGEHKCNLPEQPGSHPEPTQS